MRRALIFGVCNSTAGNGCNEPGDRSVVDVFDPATDTFSTLASGLVDSTRMYLRPVLLPDGKVLVTSAQSATAEIFDPETDTFALLPTQSINAEYGYPARLRDGRVALMSPSFIEIYDADSGNVSALSAGMPNRSAVALTLPDGRVVSPGGHDTVNNTFSPSQFIGVFDPASSDVSILPQTLSSPRLKFASALLRDGTVMVAAGVDEAYPTSYACQLNTFPTTDAVDVIDPLAGTVAAFPPLPEVNMELVATTLADESILIGGGSPCGGAGAYPYLYYLESLPVPN